MYISGANNVYIGPGGNGQWSHATSISNDYKTMTISGTTNLYYKLEGTEYQSSKNPFTLQSKNIDVSSVYEAGWTAHYNAGFKYTQNDLDNAAKQGKYEVLQNMAPGWDLYGDNLGGIVWVEYGGAKYHTTSI